MHFTTAYFKPADVFGDIMKRLFALCIWALLATATLATAQQSATLSGIIDSEDELAEGSRVAIHVVDADNVWGREVASVAPVAGTFTITAEPLSEEELRPFRSGAVVLPGLQNEYRVEPAEANYARGRVNMYVDINDNGMFDRIADAFYVGIATLEEPIGYFSLLYVDRPVSLIAAGTRLELETGWNVFTVRFPEEGPRYDARPTVDDVVLGVFLP